jgi:long-subunit fatty acid transport protein
VFTIGANYLHKLYLGATLGITSVRYDAMINHTEEWDDAGLPTFFSFNQEMYTRGTGYSFKVGAIFKPVEMIRIGGAFHLPTFFRFEDETYNTMESSYVSGVVVPTDINGSQLDPDIVTYRMETPFKAIGSVGVQLKKMGLISLEYEFVDYSNIRFRSDASAGDYDIENQLIAETYGTASNIRAGAEFRLGSFALRGGYAYYGSPYISGTENEDSDHTILSAGFGIRERNFFFDLGYSHTMHGERHYLYELEQDGAFLESSRNRLVATVGFKF